MDMVAANTVPIEGRDRRVSGQGCLLAGVDMVVIFACFALSRVVNWAFSGLSWEATWSYIRIHSDSTPFLVHVALGFTCVIAFRQLGHYDRRRPFWQELGDIMSVVGIVALADAALLFMTKTSFSRLWWAASWSSVAVMVPLARLALKRLLMDWGAWLRPTVIIGTGPNAIDAASALISEPLLGFEIVAFLRPPESSSNTPAHLEVAGSRFPVLDSGAQAEPLPAHLGRPHVVVALEMAELARFGDYVESLSLHNGDIEIVSPMRGLPLARTRVTHFFSYDVLTLRLYNNLSRPWPRLIKRAFDIVVGGALLTLTAPLLAFIAWGVACTGRPIVYRHPRIGRAGRRFRCLKFRTMVPNADAVLARHLADHPEAREQWLRDRKLKHDPRITPLGAWLRRTSLDELPQLINVILGDMSLVGPRPVVEDELPRYGANLVYYMESTPGITGLWQVSGRNDVDYRRRVHLDSWYVKNWSLWWDLVILIKTLRAVLRCRGAY